MQLKLPLLAVTWIRVFLCALIAVASTSQLTASVRFTGDRGSSHSLAAVVANPLQQVQANRGNPRLEPSKAGGSLETHCVLATAFDAATRAGCGALAADVFHSTASCYAASHRGRSPPSRV